MPAIVPPRRRTVFRPQGCIVESYLCFVSCAGVRNPVWAFTSSGVRPVPQAPKPCRLCTRCGSLTCGPEIIKDTNEVAIKIDGHKLAQLPRFVLGLGNDLRLRGLPLCEKIVHITLAVEIEPEKDRACVAGDSPRKRLYWKGPVLERACLERACLERACLERACLERAWKRPGKGLDTLITG
jgi:hypothetical protein